MKYVCLIITILAVFCGEARAEVIVSNNILSRVFYIKYEKSYGTAFTIEVDNRQYLITAKHVIANIKNEDKIELYNEQRWKKVGVSIIRCKDATVDIVVLAPETKISPTYALTPTMGNIFLSQDVYFLGFPYGIHTEMSKEQGFYPIPFVKKGILSAMDNRKKEAQILYIDGHNNPGFSGGPVVYKNYNTKELCVAGVVSGYRNHSDKVLLGKKTTNLHVKNNSGIVVAYAINAAVEAIRANPIGPLVT